ncbi:efflux RND transporter periplasmic adaptor subunit [Nannocystis radixulma]|uniref:Efflux RND transporter periplasmic adaptor subunit n=1 Tax=Nannocystis radixulma TaxID=2995305 RepID=A0ABT5B9Y5_9BACT|nr:efflux RND transporter periplasmic adaptor subunit [Nannocystis radixulma]MDC0670951.1 efflux RND transporter periplasmic adaptor subunit [Nannocystis radixulma]
MTARPQLIPLVLAGLLVAACDAKEAEKPSLPSSQASAPPTIPTPSKGPAPQPGIKAGARDLSIERYVGTALPKQEAELGPRMSGTLASVDVEEGQMVKKGQVLFRLDARSTRLGVSQAETGLQGAKIARDNAKRELERQQQLAAKGTIAAAVLERAESAFNSAENGVSQSEVALSMARRGTADSAVISPIDGLVAHKLKDVGETVTMMPPTIVVVIQDQSVLEVRARIPEAALRLVHVGDQVTAHFSALGVSREAKVVRVQPTVDAATRTIEIVTDVDNKEGTLRPGMYVEIELRPPLASVLPGAEGEKPAAEVAPDAKAEVAKATPSKKAKSDPPPPSAGTH